MARQNTQLESEGAEFLVLGQLLIEGVPSYKAYTRNRGYDLVATNPEKNRSARIQVKSRWATDFDGGYIIKNTDHCDFVVFVALNRGYRFRKKHLHETGKKDPIYYVFPVDLVRKTARTSWGKTFLKQVPNFQAYEHNWRLIMEFLSTDHSQANEHDVI